jgi:hypothetical protein
MVITIAIVHKTVTIMKYALSGTVVLALHRDFTFSPLHCHFIAFTSTPQFAPL